MNGSQVEFFNVGAFEEIPGLGAPGLMRVPLAVRNQMNERARFVGMDSVGCEVRFVSDAPNVDVYVSCLRPEFGARGELRVFKGNFQCQAVEVEPGRVMNIRLNPPLSFDSTRPEKLDGGGFASQVWRLAMNRGATFAFHGLDVHGHELRAPRADELPAVNWLAYGSSITNSSLDGYPHVAARVLKAQVQNKGLSGACHLEPAMVDWLVDACQWDVATLEMGINMRGCFTPEQFEERAAYAIERFAATGRPVLVTHLFPNGWTPGNSRDTNALPTQREAAFNQTVERLARDQAADNLHFVPGEAILDDFTGLGGDLLHPCNYGHAVMGLNLARLLRQKLLG